jgi:hypothetical protein
MIIGVLVFCDSINFNRPLSVTLCSSVYLCVSSRLFILTNFNMFQHFGNTSFKIKPRTINYLRGYEYYKE